MATDQLEFTNPVERFASISPPEQRQPEPGLEAKMDPVPDIGEHTYRGTGRLRGRKALITGGDSGIGAATAVAFAREGADVAIAYLPVEETDAANVARIIAESGQRVVQIPGDLMDPEYPSRVVEEAVRELGGLDILVNNAAKQVAIEGLADLSDDQLEETFTANILSMFRLTRAALPHLQPGSSIINTTSIQAYQPSPTLLDYAATKAAINNFSKGLAEELAPKGIRVNAVAPGPIWTAIQPSDGQPIEKLPDFGKDVGLGRAGQPTELAPAYVFLASSESSYVLGATIHVNGGQPTP
ncbi:SDR family oxidoreductase [Pseudactinotalea sp. Z1739]|uniref:SDR family oxidoreductase n=1 Tax=Pseudactinotalea sp. Z1739 TaxID=3413028 RepID=UPI003C7B0C33